MKKMMFFKGIKRLVSQCSHDLEKKIIYPLYYTN